MLLAENRPGPFLNIELSTGRAARPVQTSTAHPKMFGNQHIYTQLFTTSRAAIHLPQPVQITLTKLLFKISMQILYSSWQSTQPQSE
jgi:hypothetical protein